mmetsp:Transcript_25664/g.41022  ORF Transcript_25664/g.41022 Transcript_25664/m.41022 type:complete len:157 (-) Transcript_25664:563-1033(-)
MFFEGAADDADQAWANSARGGRQSDAVLSCPCCLEIVTIDCQKHARHHDQWRAMFVQNVRVDTSSALRPNGAGVAGRGDDTGSRGGGREEGGQQSGRKHAGTGTGTGPEGAAAAAAAAAAGEGPYNEVFCETCNTLVGVRDADEVYHFFQVFPSTA